MTTGSERERCGGRERGVQVTQSPPPNALVICLANVCCRAPSLTVTEQTESKEERGRERVVATQYMVCVLDR